MKILQISPHFSPNVGGVETHIDDLVAELTKRKHNVFVLAYQPLQTKIGWRVFERRNMATILRLPWIPGHFYTLVSKPILEFLYLFPGLFFVAPILIAFERPRVLHAHGLVAGTVAVLWGKVFRIRTVISTHNVYNFPNSGLYRTAVGLIFNGADHILCLSSQSVDEIKKIVKDDNKVSIFTSWVDLKKFHKLDKQHCKKKLGWNGNLVVLFVGRLVEEKGVLELLKAAKHFKREVTLKIAGSGPLSSVVGPYYVGQVSQDDLATYYCAADIVIVPSVHDEGFGRVILESLACGTPVIGSKRGAIPQIMDTTVGELIDVSPDSIAKAVNYFYEHPNKLKILSKKARVFTEVKYSSRNIRSIIKSYK